MRLAGGFLAQDSKVPSSSLLLIFTIIMQDPCIQTNNLYCTLVTNLPAVPGQDESRGRTAAPHSAAPSIWWHRISSLKGNIQNKTIFLHLFYHLQQMTFFSNCGLLYSANSLPCDTGVSETVLAPHLSSTLTLFLGEEKALHQIQLCTLKLHPNNQNFWSKENQEKQPKQKRSVTGWQDHGRLRTRRHPSIQGAELLDFRVSFWTGDWLRFWSSQHQGSWAMLWSHLRRLGCVHTRPRLQREHSPSSCAVTFLRGFQTSPLLGASLLSCGLLSGAGQG